MIGVDMGVDDVGDMHAFGRGELDVGVDVARLSINDGALAEAPAAEHVGGATAVVIVVGPEDHLVTPRTRQACWDHRTPSAMDSSTGSPAAFHSGKPSISR